MIRVEVRVGWEDWGLQNITSHRNGNGGRVLTRKRRLERVLIMHLLATDRPLLPVPCTEHWIEEASIELRVRVKVRVRVRSSGARRLARSWHSRFIL